MPKNAKGGDFTMESKARAVGAVARAAGDVAKALVAILSLTAVIAFEIGKNR